MHRTGRRPLADATREKSGAPLKPAIRTLLEAAIWAPSGDNTQPSKFVVDNGANTIEVQVDPTRDTSPMNAGQRMARIAVGAAVENIVQTARHNGWSAECETVADDPGAVRVRLQGIADAPGEIPQVILDRCTNRKLYNGRPLGDDLLARLKASVAPEPGVEIEWITQREEINRWAETIGAADAAMFSIPEVRRAFLENIRFDRPPSEAVSEGLSLGSLELSWFEKSSMGSLGLIPDRLFKLLKLDRPFRQKGQSLAGSASGLCIFRAEGRSRNVDFAVGRMMQRVWLALSAAGLAVQPMMSLPVLRCMDDYRREIQSQESSGVVAGSSCRTAVPPSALLRFGSGS